MDYRNSMQDKVVIVTGGAKGIGEAIVRRFDADGAKVIIADCDDICGQKLAQELTNTLFVSCDVSCEQDILKTIQFADEKFGRIDVIVNDAAWQLNKDLLNTSTADFEKLLVDLNNFFAPKDEKSAYGFDNGKNGNYNKINTERRKKLEQNLN